MRPSRGPRPPKRSRSARPEGRGPGKPLRRPDGRRREAAPEDERERKPAAGPKPKTEPRRPKKPAPKPAAAPRPAPSPSPPPRPNRGVETVVVGADEDGMRIDRYLEVHYPSVAFSHLQRIIRKGELRVDGKRVKQNGRLAAGQTLRIPPLNVETRPARSSPEADRKTLDFLASITLYEDDDILVLDKPMGLAVQGGPGTSRHVDRMIGALPCPGGQRARLVHRLDKDTSGCLLIAKSRFAAQELARTFRSRSVRKIYWALVPGLPKLRQGRVSTWLARDEIAESQGEAKMRVAEHGEEGASHALTYYAVVENAARIASWVSLKPVTGRTHQLRAHMAHLGHPIIGDEKYFDRDRWELPQGMQNRLHLLARRLMVPHPRTGKVIDVTAPLPPHMRQSWALLGFDPERFDPIEEAPEE